MKRLSLSFVVFYALMLVHQTCSFVVLPRPAVRSALRFPPLQASSGDQEKDSPPTNAEAMIQMELEEMMRQQDSQKGLQPALLGKTGDDDDVDNRSTFNGVPLFTGSIILLLSIFFSGYGIYVGITGNDPIFLNVRPTEPPPDSWYQQNTVLQKDVTN